VKISPILLLIAAPLAGQVSGSRFSFGVTGGVPLGRMTPKYAFHDESRRYTVGPTVDVSLSANFSVSAGLLYKRRGLSFGGGGNQSFFFDTPVDVPFQYTAIATGVRSHSLELPVLAKYHFGNQSRRWRPFAGTGFAFQTAFDSNVSSYFVRNKESGKVDFVRYKDSDRRRPTDTGVILSSGISFKKGPFEFSPELRYTRWGSSGSSRNRHQADALLTIRFGGKR
jgi:Outer membrane protein beta-barrel domain